MRERAIKSLAEHAVGKTIVSVTGNEYDTKITFADGSTVTLSGDYDGEVNAEWLTAQRPQ